ncbi:methyl-accepting chemotaxis protein [Vibrio panuliri]|uniref:Chemotaxis protein n=1 Tax=Vibrio panuliri TaxID=1381081 RepID=A0ABX3FB45_9VIBR|nr:HAMP domain-containing methyl-accepting chemotaxis protein [Vibrio panuliri]KAB1454376.1 methyl-accepting chemotaxis protein [Vibrio panuliri]OLQ87802.1 chemotaxis protein [Vibrio panuliri]
MFQGTQAPPAPSANTKPLRLLDRFSIKTKLLTINVILLIGVICYGFFEQYSLNNMHELELASVENAEAEIDLLTLRRHEKDFIARHDIKYQQRFDQTFTQLTERLQQLDQRITTHGLPLDGRMNTISETLEQYGIKFQQLVTQIELIDSKTSGKSLIDKLTSSRGQLRQNVINLDSLEAKVALSELMEKDFHYLAYPSEQTELELSQSLQTFYQQFAYLSNLQEAFDRYQTDLVNLFSANAQLGLTPNQGIRGDLRRTVHTTEQEILSLQGDIESSILLAADKVKIQLHIFGGLLALILSGLLMLIGRNILGRIQSIKSMMHDIAQGNGDLTVRMNASGNDELAQLANSFDSFTCKLHQLIKDVASAKEVLDQSASMSTQASNRSMNNAEQQKIESESVATAINELVHTSNEITSNIEQAAVSASNMKDASQLARDITQQASASMQTLSGDIANSQQLIEQLEDQSRQINSVISTIQGIAEQTNLLALNAAIEAARAGEHGRGFAVVADEVRDLSMKTDNSTRQIESTITNLSSQIHSTVAIMAASQEQAEATMQDTHKVVDAIDSVNQQIEELFNMNTQIATASEEQSMVSGEIDRNITHIASLASDTFTEVQDSVKYSTQVQEVNQKLGSLVAMFRY